MIEFQPLPNPGMTPQEAAIARIDNSITSMEEQQLKNDPRYAQMLQIKQKLTGRLCSVKLSLLNLLQFCYFCEKFFYCAANFTNVLLFSSLFRRCGSNG